MLPEYHSLSIQIQRAATQNLNEELQITGITMNTQDDLDLMIDSPGRGPSARIEEGGYQIRNKMLNQLSNQKNANRDLQTRSRKKASDSSMVGSKISNFNKELYSHKRKMSGVKDLNPNAASSRNTSPLNTNGSHVKSSASKLTPTDVVFEL